MPRILVVEESRPRNQELMDVLEAEGFSVALARDEQRAAELLQTSCFDIVTFLADSCIITSGKQEALDLLLAIGEEIVRANRRLRASLTELEQARLLAEQRAGQLEVRIQQSQKMDVIGRLAGGMAHDINNLLTIMNGCCELLLEQLHSDDPRHALVRETASAGSRAATLISQLLAFGRKKLGEPKIINLHDVVLDGERLLRRVLGEDIEVVTVHAPNVGNVRADPTLLVQVLLNLGFNARDAMAHGGRLTLEVRNVNLDAEPMTDWPTARTGPHVLLAVSDTGTGIPADVLLHIWEPFFTTKPEGKGTGLGLAMVQSVVQEAGGHVCVRSEVGRGTTFEVYLPHVEVRPFPSKSHPALASLPRGQETILVVEDEDAVRFLTGHILQGCGYTVLESRDGEEALRIAQKHAGGGTIQLLLTDVVMPRLDGPTLAERLAREYPRLKVLYCSGHSEDTIIEHSVFPDEGSLLEKPFSATALAEKVREVLDRKAD
jgi:two-component system cell cycle sensor histidine kinase/response regulator CckA